MKILDLSVEQLEQAAGMLKAIAHPMRIAILSFLEDGKRLTVTQIHEKLEIEQSTTSHHLGILKDNGGATATHELLAGSAAIDAGTDTGATLIDQRGISRASTSVDRGEHRSHRYYMFPEYKHRL